MPNKGGEKRPRKSRYKEPKVIRCYEEDPEAMERAIRSLLERGRKSPSNPPRGQNQD